MAAINSQELHIVFGTGPLGVAVVRELLSRGKLVRVASRTRHAHIPNAVETVLGDAANPSFTRQVCGNASVVYHCANPAYARWPQDFPPLQISIIEGVASSGAKLIYGDNLYMYGPVSRPLTEDLPYRASGPNGRTRAEMATMLLEAHEKGKIRVAIGRASDFYGPHVLRSTVGERVFGAALQGKAAQVLGNPDLPHTYTYIGDFATALVTLGERDEALGQVWHVPSAETLTTRQFVGFAFQEVGAPPQVVAASRRLVSLMALFSPAMRALKEQLYQLEQPFIVDHSKYASAFGVHVTPHRDAIRKTLAWYRENWHTRKGVAA